MHDFLVLILSLASAAIWWISIFALSPLYKKIAGDSENQWRQGVALVLPFLLAALLTVIAAHVLEHLFHVQILSHGDDDD